MQKRFRQIKNCYILGFTWSPVVKSSQGYKVEPQDRIDMIWYRNATVHWLRPTQGEKPKVITGKRWRRFALKSSRDPSAWANEWPSDHAAVTAQFEICC